MDTERIGDVEEDTALTADVLLVRAGTSGAGSAVHRGGVSAALGGGVSPQPDVSSLSPPLSPGVPHQPVVAQALVSPVPDQLDRVVEGDVGVVAAALVDSSSVPAPAGGVHSHSQGPDLG